MFRISATSVNVYFPPRLRVYVLTFYNRNSAQGVYDMGTNSISITSPLFSI